MVEIPQSYKNVVRQPRLNRTFSKRCRVHALLETENAALNKKTIEVVVDGMERVIVVVMDGFSKKVIESFHFRRVFFADIADQPTT